MIRLFFSTTFLLVVLVGRVWCLSAIQGSPCYDPCHGDQATSSADIICTDDDFTNSTKGDTLSQCLTCLQTSSYESGFMTDSILFLYYLSSVQQTCLSGKPAEPISDCSTQCTNISSAFSSVGGRNFFQSPYAYCTENDNAYESVAADCATCLQSQDGTVILGNFVRVGQIGCDTQPDVRSGALVYTSDDLFDTAAIGSGSTTSVSASATSRTSSIGTTTTTSSSTRLSGTTTSTSAPASTTSASASSSASASASATAASSNSDGNEEKGGDTRSSGLSRGAAAGIGIAVGLLGIIAVVLLALLARKRMVKKEEGRGPFRRMQDSPQMKQVQDNNRSATPPGAGVFVPPGIVPAVPAAAIVAPPKKSKSFKSAASKSMKSLKNQMTPRTSEWYYAANPKHSEDLSALPQKGWD